MKKSRLILMLIMMFALTVSLCACAGNKQKDKKETDNATQKQSESTDSSTGQKEDNSEIEAENKETSDETDEVDETDKTEEADEVDETDKTEEADEVDETDKTEEADEGRNILVVYFSVTGTTKKVAERIAALEEADIYEIIPEEKYTSDDIDYNNSESRASKEQNDSSVRPKIGSETINLSGYEKIYIGYPIWFGQEPRIMDTFVEAYDFKDITIIPFCTSGSSGIGQSGNNLEKNAGSGIWKDGQRFDGNVSEDELRSWIEGLD